MALLCVAQFVQAGDWVQVTVQFTKLSMHVSVAPASAVGRRRRAQQQHAQPEPDDVWEEETTQDNGVITAVDESATTLRNWSAANESEAWRRRNSGWVWLDT
jgi:Tfp pilus assembly protein FimT